HAEIDACDRCNDRGVLPSGVLCTHDARAERAGGGKAEFESFREEWARQRAARAQTTTGGRPPRASSEQLAKLAIHYEQAGMDRDARLADLSARLGRDVTTMTTLTRVEASVAIDHFEAPPLPDEPPAPAAEHQPWCIPLADVDNCTCDTPPQPGESAVDPRWSDPNWERVPLDDGGPDDPGTFVPRLDPGDADDEDPPFGVDVDDVDDDPDHFVDDQPDYVYAGADDSEPPF
ncbi:MAG: hypothetical protein HOQ45_20415, partial [Nocardioidaceae bacterium]|nr:hypothetical protein [Nocardioidaceae bacterium]